MDLSQFLDTSHCLVDLRYGDKAACLGDLGKRAAGMLGLEAGPVVEALRARETLGSTGLGNGIALPHARLPGIVRPFALMARLREPIPFEAVDDRLVDIVCLALLPAAEKAGEQLQVLACIARRLRDGGTLDAVRRARDARALLAAVGVG